MPRSPSSAIGGITSGGKRSSLSQAAAFGTTCLAQKSRTVFCRTCCSSQRSKFMVLLVSRSRGRGSTEALLGAGRGVDLHHDRRHGTLRVGELGRVRLVRGDVERGLGAEAHALAAYREIAPACQ